MPIYEVDGERYDIPEGVMSDFEKDNPNASVIVNGGGGKYSLPLSERDSFFKDFKDASYDAPSIPKTDMDKVNAYSDPTKEKAMGIANKILGEKKTEQFIQDKKKSTGNPVQDKAIGIASKILGKEDTEDVVQQRLDRRKNAEVPVYKGDTSPEEYRTKGNINLAERNGRVENEDGSVSTVRTMSFNEGGKEILIPTIIPNGMGGWKQADADEAIDYYHKTGENLGKFNTVAEADKYAKKVHEIEAQRIGEDAANDWHAPKQEEEEESGFGKYYSDKPMKTDGFADVEGYDFNTAKAAEEMQAYQTKKQKEGLLEKLQKHYDDRYAQDFANLNYLSESELKKREDDLNNIKSEMASMKKEIDAIPQTEQRYNELVAWMGSTTKMMENTLPAPKYVAEKSGGDLQKGAADVYAEVNKAYQNTPLGRKDYNKIKARQQELAADAEESFMKTPDAVSIVKELDAIKNAKYTTKADVDNANGKMKALYDELNAKYGEYANGLYANDEKLNELSKTYSDNAVAAGYGWYQQSMYEVENANINSLIDMADKEMARNESASQGTFWTSFAESQVRSTPSVMALGDGEGTTAGTLAKVNENYDKSKTVRRTLIDANKTLVAEKQRRDGTMKGLGFVRGVSNVNYENFVPFAGLSDSFTKLGLSLDIRNGKTYDQLDDMDKALVDAMQLEAYANANYGNNAGAFERLGGRAPELIKFTLEYLATGGLTGAGKIGERIATKGAEKFAMKQAGKSISKFADVAGRRVLPTIEGMAAEAGMRTFANPIGIGNIMRKTADNMAGNVYFDEFGNFHAFDDNKDFALSFWQGAMTEYLSNLTESFGEHLFGRIPRKLLESGELKYAGTQLGNMFKLMSKNKISDSFRLSSRVSSALGIQGVKGESEEEFSENLLTPLVYADAEQGENYFNAFKRSIRQSFSKRNVLDTFMSCAFMSMGTGMAVNGVNKAMNGFLSESGIAAAKDEKILKTFKGVEIKDLRHFIQNHSLEEIDQHIIDLAEDNGWNDDQKMAAAVYVLDMGRYAQEKRYESLGMKEQLKEAEQSAKDLVNRRDGENIYNATLSNGEQVNIVGGEVGFSVDEEGNPILNKATSSSTFTVRLSDGSVDMVSSNEVKSLDAVISFQEQIANDKKAIMQKAEAKMQAEGLITPTMKNVWGEEPKAGNITIVDGKECTFTGVKDEKGYELKDEKGNSIHITEKAWIDYGVGIKMNELAKLAGLSEQEKQDAFNMLADANDDLETMGKMLSMSKEKVEQSEWDGLTKVFSDRMQFDKSGNIIDYGEPIVTAGYLLAVSKGDADAAMQMLQEEIEQKRTDSESYKGKNMADSAKGRNQAKSDYENLQGVAKILEQFADKRAEASNVSNKVEVEQGKTYKAIIDGEERNAMFASDNGNGTISVAFLDEDGHPTGSTDMTKSKFRRCVSEYQAKNNPQQDTAEQDNAAKAESAPQGEENGTTQEDNEAAYPTDKKGNPLWMQMTDEQVDAALAELSELGIDVKDYIANILGEAKKRKAKADKVKPKSTDFVKVKEEAVKIAEEKAASSANMEFWQRQSDRINKTTEAATTQEAPAATEENQTQDTDTQETATETTEETQEEQTPEETATEEAPADTETEAEAETPSEETPSEETPAETQQETETEVPTEQETEKPNEETPETEESDDVPNEESDDLNTQQESEQIKDAAAKVIAETSEGSTGNKFTDSGEKIGGAKKDQGITHKKNDSENSGVPTWRKKYSITNEYPDDVYSRNKPIIGEGKFIITYEKKHKGLRNRTTTRIVGTSLFGDPIIFNSIEDAERFIPIQEAQDQGFRVAKEEDGKYFIGRRASNGKIVKYASFETEEDAKAYLASEEGCKSLLNHKRENFELPALDKITRNGKDWRKGKHITNTKVFMDEFGFRGVEFGEWLNQDERQQFIDYAYDALCDLADVLGISRKALSLNGELSIAFGARGSKGTKAHYEPNRAVINLTKMNGAGSLAHEWAHALDNYFGLMQRDKEVKRDENGVITNSSTEDFSSEEESFMNKGLRPEVLEAIKKIVSVMRSKEVTSKMDVKNAQKSLDYVKERFENTKKRIIDRATNGTDSYVYNRKTKKRESVHYAATPEQIARITELLDNIGERKDKGMKSEWEGYWTLTGNDYKELIDILADVFHYKRGGKDIHEYMERSSGFMYDADKIISCDNYLQRALNNESETTTVKTDLLLDSESFDRGRASAYFSRKLEMFARCFETYVNDKMRENGTNNDYLTYSKSPIYIEMFGKSPYPEGEEKKAINEAFDNLFNTVQEKTVDGKQVLYQKHYDTDSPIATKKQAKKISGKLKKLGLKGQIMFAKTTKEAIDMSKRINEQIAERMNRYQSVFHGSPNDFESFDFSHMGEGEGSQSYGWGGYVTEVEGIGEAYAQMRSDWRFDGYKLEDVINNGYYDRVFNFNELYYAHNIDELRSKINNSYIDGRVASPRSKRVKEFNKQKQILLDAIDSGRIINNIKSNLYRVDIPDDNGVNYLHWEKDVDEEERSVIAQSIRNKLIADKDENGENYYDSDSAKNELGKDLATAFGLRIDGRYWIGAEGITLSGDKLYGSVVSFLGSDKEASEFLNNYGFVGISYPAQYQSGGRNDGARNYVIFNASDMKITDHSRYSLNENGEVAGITLPNGDVILVEGNMRVDTPFHEFAHKIFAYAKDNKETSRLYDAVLKVAENAPDNVKEYVKKHYSDLEGEEYLDEVFAWALCAMNKGNLSEFLGERGFETGSPVDMAKAQTWYDKVWNAIKELWDSVKGVFNGGRYADLSVFDAYDEMSVESLSQKLYDVMMGGKKLPNAVEDNSETERSQRTLTQEDMDYLDAVERGDMEAAQRMVDEAADKRLEEWQKLQDDKDMVAYKYHRGRLGKNTKKMYAVFNVGENGMTPAYAGTENTIPIGAVLDAQNLTSYQSKTKKDDNGNPTSYVAGTTGASFKDAGLSKDEVPQSLWNKRWLLERGGKHGSDVPNFSQMNVKNAETGEMGANGAMPHNKLVFEIECYYDEDLTEEAKNGRTIKGKQQGFPKIEPNQFYDFKTNPNAKGNWGVAGTFKITRVVPYSEIVQKCEEAGLKPQVWNGGYNPSEFGVSESEVQKKVEEGEAKKLLDPVTYDDNGNVIPLSQRFNKSKNDVRYQKVDTDSDTKGKKKKEKVELFPEGSKGKLQDKEVFARDEVNRHIGSNNSTSSFYNRAVNQFVMKWADGLRPLRKAMELIAKMTNKPIRDSENAFVKALLAGSIAVAKMKNEAKPLINNLCLEIALIVKKSNASIDEITDYLIAKHGLERNKWFKDKVDAEATKGMNEEEVTAYIDEEGLSELEDKSGLRGLSEKLGLDPNNYTANAEKVVADFEEKNGDCKSLWNALHNITGYILNTDLATGRIDADTMEEFKTRWEYYIPLRGFANPTSDEYYDYSVKDASMNLAERKAKGRTSLADSPIATLLNMLDSSITMACQNDARKALYYFALNHKSDLFVTAKSWYVKNEKTGEWEEASLQDRGIVFNPNNPISNDELQQRVAEYDKEMEALRKKGLAKHDVNPREMGVIVKPALVDEHIVECYINGKKYMVINTGDPDIIKSLNGKEEHWGSYDSKTRIFKDSESGFFDAVNKIYQNPDRALKNIVRFEAKIKTSWSPTFFLNNFKKDIPFAIFSAYVSGGGKNALVFTKNVGKAMWYIPSLIAKGRCRSAKVTQYWNEFINSGGETGFTRNMSVDYHEKEYRKLVGKLLKGKDISKDSFRLMEFANRWSEDVSRFGAYVSSRENGGSIQESTLAAKNITLNFSQHGNGLGASFCRSRYNFFNANIQSNYRVLQLAKENPVRFTAAVVTIMASGIAIPMLNLMSLSMWGDDDDWRTYRFLSDYMGYHNLVIFTGNGFYIQPIPQEFILFWGTGVSISRHYMGYERETTVKGDIARLAMEYIPFDIAAQGDTNYIYTLLRAATPDYAKTITECAVNQNFMGSHIYKETPYNKDDAGWTKAMPDNYEFLVNICKKLNHDNAHEKDGINLNPAIIEHIVKGYTGGIGQFVHDVSKGVETAAQGDLDWNKIPYIRQTYVTPDIRKYKGGVYTEANYYIFDVMKNTDDRYKAYIQDLVAIQGGIDYYDNSMRKAEQDKAYKDTGNDVFRMNSERLSEKMREYEATPEYQQCKRILEHLDEIKASPEFAIASNETSMALSNTIQKLREYRKRARHESDVSDEDLRNGELTYEYLDNELIHLEIDFISNAEQILDKDSRGNSIREKAATWRKNINFENGDDYEGTTEEDTDETDENE